MNEIKHKNLIFIGFLIFIILIISIFNLIIEKNSKNFFSDYEIHNKIKFKNFEKNLISSKDKNYNTIIIGGSSTMFLFPTEIIDKYQIAKIAFGALSYKELYEIIIAYFSIHKETKRIILPIEYQTFLNKNKQRFKSNKIINYEKNSKILNKTNEIYSIDTTITNIESITSKIRNNQDIKNKFFKKRPKAVMNVKFTRITDNNLIYIDKIFQYLIDNKIEIICYIPPYHALYTIGLYKHNNIEFITQYILNKNINIYDFSTFNEINTTPFRRTKLYIDVAHPIELYTSYILPIILKKEHNFIYKSQNLYTLLTKKNYKDEKIKKQQQIKKYKIQNRREIKKFYSYKKNCNSKDFKYTKKIYYSTINKDILTDYQNLLKEGI